MTSSTAASLLRLAAERATGALMGRAGTLFLVDGAVVHAESPAATGVDVLLTTGGRLAYDSWQAAVDQAGARRSVGRFLADSGLLAVGELEICHLSALFDASYFVLSDEGATRFRHGAEHWFGPLRPVRASLVERESRRRRQLLENLWPFPQVDTEPVMPRRVAESPALSHRSRQVLDLANGELTASHIAQLLGRPTFHVLVDVRRLAAIGLVDTPSATPPGPVAPVGPWTADAPVDPDVELLRRVRDALEARL
ncbi:transcriptional regulator [Streptomyces sp. RPT161]|uniref:transcriptional regulator n=1 Tax=Streptomyces sp. RPT161 TaxID=3015993 RepID=UPI0022B91D92|nr:transcriptional regulator [Streptomyces sp. RPT161]